MSHGKDVKGVLRLTRPAVVTQDSGVRVELEYNVPAPGFALSHRYYEKLLADKLTQRW